MQQIFLAVIIACLAIGGVAVGDTKHEAKSAPATSAHPDIRINPIGLVKAEGDRKVIELRPELAPALDGLSTFSRVWVIFWFHENDAPEKRATLKVHPRRNPANPLTGVFATRAPVRPNLIGMTCCRIVGVNQNLLEVDGLDAHEGSPVLDLKPYLPMSDAHPEAHTPEWVKKRESW
jgi:tRNA (adenine37-N6)-methyltransferase